MNLETRVVRLRNERMFSFLPIFAVEWGGSFSIISGWLFWMVEFKWWRD